MYEIVKPCPKKIIPPKDLKDFHPDINAETVLLEEVFYHKENHRLGQHQDVLSADYYGKLENQQYQDNTAYLGQRYICKTNNLIQLEHEINCLKISLIKSIRSHQETLEEKLKQGMDFLQEQSQKINDLSAQLEAEILKFQSLAREVNQDYHALQNYQHQSKESSSQLERIRPANIWEIRSSLIPRVVKQGNQFILTTKPVEEVAADNPENRVKKAQQRQKALECWLEAKRQRIIQDFSSP
ncbi:hypothetical protein [Planktothricoides raciborskii]|uniref:Uncharacterized protein n=1 Tax=Planktothricoides raciborskii GIHE-MW2 TaxID=2792601 RepID=A0AAU8JAL9_9CYAN